MNYSKYICLMLAMVSLLSCNDEVAKTYESKPMALARMNEIIVVAEEDLWDSAVRDTFDYYFQSAYPIMPSPEPIFDMRHFTPIELGIETLRKELRTYMILADLNDPESTATKMLRRDLGEERYIKAKEDPTFSTSVGKDKWARGQIIIYLFAKGEKALNKVIRENYSAIAKRIRLHDAEPLDASIFVLRSENKAMMRDIQERFGFTMRVPGDYIDVKPNVDNFLWLRKDTKKALMNIVVQKFPYESKEQLTVENIIQIRDAYGKQHISSNGIDSYMVTNTEDLPTYDYVYELDGQYTKEVRGIWEMENDFLGGPYSTYVILNEATNELIFIDTFVLGPGQKKRDLMMQLDYIVKTAKIGNGGEQ